MRVKADSLEGRMAHAFLDGVDVSAGCVEADDEQGWVELLVRDKKGHIEVDVDNVPFTKLHFGTVVIKL